MELGAFSVSLAVKDLEVSKTFYEKLGFEQTGGDAKQNWVIMKSGKHIVGLFQGMFENNVMTFNPGWDQDAQELKEFTDVRELQKMLQSKGVEVGQLIDSEEGPGSFMVVDPDGNAILFDQHR